MSNDTPNASARAAWRTRLRVMGITVLLASLGGAFALYVIRTRASDVMDDPMLADYSRADSHQMEILYGRMGSMITDLMEDLRRPGVQAVLIGLGGIVFASGCFFVAGRMEEGDVDEGEGRTSNIEP